MYNADLIIIMSLTNNLRPAEDHEEGSLSLFQRKLKQYEHEIEVNEGKVSSRRSTNLIRAFLMSAASDNERKERQKIIADQYGLSPQSVGAMLAWVKYGDRKMKEIVQLEDIEREQIKEYLEDLEEPFDVAIMILELRDCFGVSTEALYDFRNKLQKPQERALTESHSGESVSYDNETKEAWRKTWMDYIIARTTAETRAQMRVLTMPGKDCLNIPHYLEAGFRPENIVGVEGGSSEVRHHFSEQAARYGIQTRLGKIKRVVKAERDSFGVVDLDFCGQLSESKVELFRHLPLDDYALALVNVWARREGKDIQIAMRESTAVAQAAQRWRLQEDLLRLQGREHDIGLLDLLKSRTRRELVAKMEKVANIRDEAISRSFVVSAGVNRKDKWLSEKDVEELMEIFSLPEAPEWFNSQEGVGVSARYRFLESDKDLRELLLKNVPDYSLKGPLAERVKQCALWIQYRWSQQDSLFFTGEREVPQREMEQYGIHLLLRMAALLPVAPASLVDLERYSYISSSGSGGTEFYTDMMTLSTPRAVAVQCRKTVSFLVKAYLQVLRNQLSVPRVAAFRDKTGRHEEVTVSMPGKTAPDGRYDYPYISVIDRKGTRVRKPKRMKQLKATDVLVLKRRREVLSQLTIGQMIQDMEIFAQYLAEFPSTSPITHDLLLQRPRRRIGSVE